MPIVDTIYKVVHGELSIDKAGKILMGRKLSHEYNTLVDDFSLSLKKKE